MKGSKLLGPSVKHRYLASRIGSLLSTEPSSNCLGLSVTVVPPESPCHIRLRVLSLFHIFSVVLPVKSVTDIPL